MFERRLQILLAVLAVVCFGLVMRAFSLQAVGRGHWTAESEKAMSDEREVPTIRGRLLDVKGRELAIDQPCINACVHYEAIAANRPLKQLREAALVRLIKKNNDYEKLDAAERQRLLDAEVVVGVREAGPGADKWLRDTARTRLKKRIDNYPERPLAERKKLLNAEMSAVLVDVEQMWDDLAKVSREPPETLEEARNRIDETRRQIVRRVETRRRLVWYRKFKDASEAVAEPSFWSKLLGGGEVDLDKFDVHVSEERDVHVILPNISLSLRNELARRSTRYPGLAMPEAVMRVYPYGAVACQTIGRIANVTPDDLLNDPMKDERLAKYNATDDIGREGLEKLCEQQLRGRRGLVATSGVDDESTVMETPPVPGADVATTLDVELQKKVEQAFKSVRFVRAQGLEEELEMNGAAVIIDLPTGQVRAMASWPTYDLNQFDKLFPTLVRDQFRRPLSNRATMLAVEPGSTVKPIVGIGAISAGIFRPDETIRCDGFVVINGQRHTKWGRCWTQTMFKKSHMELSNPPASANLNFVEALQRSCNVFHEELAYRLGLEGVSHWFEKFGLGRPTGIGLPEASGILPTDWRGPSADRMFVTCLAGIGEHDIHATPIQMANVAATIARDGVFIPPTVRADQQHAAVDLGLSKAALAEARKGMFDVVNTPGGTGRDAQMQELIVSAKTGSAQTSPLRIPQRDPVTLAPVRDDRGRVIYDDVRIGTHANPNPQAPWYRATGADEKTRPAHGWMIGYAPAEKPKVAFAVLVEYGGGGGPAAGSVVRKLLAACEEEGYVTPSN